MTLSSQESPSFRLTSRARLHRRLGSDPGVLLSPCSLARSVARQ